MTTLLSKLFGVIAVFQILHLSIAARDLSLVDNDDEDIDHKLLIKATVQIVKTFRTGLKFVFCFICKCVSFYRFVVYLTFSIPYNTSKIAQLTTASEYTVWIFDNNNF